MRADQLLVARGLAASRTQAQRVIATGVQWRAGARSGAVWQMVARNSDILPDEAELQVLDDRETRYVSRGGVKLEFALAQTGVVVSGRWCLDVGQSTGGFTDCLLREGALSVTGVDVGHGQLHPSLLGDPRVRCHEHVNARDPAALAALGEAPFDLIVGDLSFISQTLVLPALRPWLAPEGDLLMLVKPQFELQPEQIGKGGIVRDERFFVEVEQRIRACCEQLKLEVRHWFSSPITGGDGNREYFMHAVPGPDVGEMKS